MSTKFDIKELDHIFNKKYGKVFTFLDKDYRTVNSAFQDNVLTQYYPAPLLKVQQNNMYGNLLRTSSEYSYVKLEDYRQRFLIKSFMFLDFTVSLKLTEELQQDWIYVLNFVREYWSSKNYDMEFKLVNYSQVEDDLTIYLNDVKNLTLFNIGTREHCDNVFTNVKTYLNSEMDAERINIFWTDENDYLLLQSYCKCNDIKIEGDTFYDDGKLCRIINSQLPLNTFKILCRYPRSSYEKDVINDLLTRGIDIKDWNNVWIYKDANNDYFI